MVSIALSHLSLLKESNIHNKIIYNQQLLQLSVFLASACLLELFHLSEIKTVGDLG